MTTNVICMPKAGQYPALAGLKPQWWNTGDVANPPSDVRDPNHPNCFWAGLDDPRWAGSLQNSYGNGDTTPAGFAEQVLFRALQFKSGANSFLYLSWNVKVDPDNSVSNQDYVWVGFNLGFNPTTPAPPATSDLTPKAAAPAVLIKIALDNSANAGVGTREGAVAVGGSGNPGTFGSYSLTAFQNTSGVNTGNWSSVSTATLNTWTWLTQFTRVWAQGGANPTWAIQMVIPVTTTLDLTQGLKLGNLFGMCYFVHVYSTTIGPIPYKWPTSIADTIGSTTFPDPTTFPLCTLDLSAFPAGATGYACDLTGITLPEDHIGTHNVADLPSPPGTGLVNPQLIKFANGSTTRFFARPVNNDPGLPIPAGSIDATFRLANWGSTTQWTTINGPKIQHPAINPAPGPGNEQEIQMDWTATAADEAFYSNHRHQCMLVELSTSMPNLTFVNASVARNMDFVHGSKFSRNAEISLRGLPPFSSQPRDVYLYIETANMPTKAGSETLRGNAIVDEFMKGLQKRHGDDNTLAQGSSNVQFREILKYVPTYRVHVYRDTGRRVMIDGTSRPVLEPQPSFGYYVWHEGNLEGWETRLYGAEKIAENLYRVHVPNNGTVTVETAIQARESANEQPLPPDGNVGCCSALAAWLDTKGPIGKLAAQLVRLICKLLGQPTT